LKLHRVSDMAARHSTDRTFLCVVMIIMIYQRPELP
jgi:hypothetical protein